LIGWGLFGLADTSSLPAALQLGNPVKYIVATLVLHLIYGGIVGWLNPLWGHLPQPQQPAQHAAA
jgi:hypothetical protein